MAEDLTLEVRFSRSSLSDLEKSLSSALGKGTRGAISRGSKEEGIGATTTKGTGGRALAAMIGTLGGMAFVLRRMLGTAENSSGILQSTFSIMGEAFSLFYKPFGDALGTALLPMAESMINFADDLNNAGGWGVIVSTLGVIGTAIAGLKLATGTLSLANILFGGATTAALGTSVTASLAPFLPLIAGLVAAAIAVAVVSHFAPKAEKTPEETAKKQIDEIVRTSGSKTIVPALGEEGIKLPEGVGKPIDIFISRGTEAVPEVKRFIDILGDLGLVAKRVEPEINKDTKATGLFQTKLNGLAVTTSIKIPSIATTVKNSSAKIRSDLKDTGKIVDQLSRSFINLAAAADLAKVKAAAVPTGGISVAQGVQLAREASRQRSRTIRGR